MRPEMLLLMVLPIALESRNSCRGATLAEATLE